MGNPSSKSAEDKVRIVLAVGARTGVLRTSRPSVRKISSKSLTNWLARSRSSARVWVNRLG